MRRLWIVGGFVLVAAVGMGLSAGNSRGQPAAGDKDPNHRKVTVSGTATVTVKPDTARVSFAVKASGQDFKKASEECDKKAATVEKAIKDLKLGGLEIKKGPLNFNQVAGGFGPGFPGPPGGPPGPPPGPMGGGPGMPPFPGMGSGMSVEVTRTFTVVATFGKEGGAGKLEDIVTVADKLLAAAVTAGATDAPVFNTPVNSPYGGIGIGGGMQTNNRIEFHCANIAALRRDALKSAVSDALANAKAAAGVANLTTKDIVTITDQSQFGPFGGVGQPMNTGRGEVLGEMELTVQVSVTFSY
ncbi:MAG: SIMPL domain-containing protein [Planctomycetia bacterium]|nr:SIMPL domain-containing protein [Planctomycetia bacterium]